MHGFAIRSILLSLLLAPPAGAAPALPETGLSEEQRVLHALNRLGFGPRPGDLDRVREQGLETWIAGQLERSEDAAVEKRLEAYETLSMAPTELLTTYPPPQLLRGLGRRLTQRMGMDEDAVNAMFPELELFDERRKQAEEGEDPGDRDRHPAERMQAMMSRPARIMIELGQAKLIRAVHSESQLHEVMTDFWFNHFNVYSAKGSDRWWVSSYERDAIRPHALGKFRDLLGATAEHPAMLFYLDNWLSTAPGAQVDRRLLESYGNQAIRRQGLPPGGVATLILRDRGMDTREIERQLERRETGRGRRPPRQAQEDPRRQGLNENYARELLELHTLGVDGGYTQDDIVEVARCFTGWTLLPLHAGQQFVYVDEMHERGDKTVLGKKIKGKGEAEGRAVLDLLARHPSTARFVSTKIARRFVGDDPPATLVDAMTRTFLETDGDIRRVLLRMIESEQFWSPDAVRAKVKTPFEYVVSLLRATDAELADPPGIADEKRASRASARRRMPGALGALRDLGMPLYGAQPPTGYDDTAEAWVSTGALMSRFKVAFAVASDKLPGVRVGRTVPAQGDLPTRDWLADLGHDLIGETPSESTLTVLEEQLALDPAELEDFGVPPRWADSDKVRSTLALAWLAASPEFQRR